MTGSPAWLKLAVSSSCGVALTSRSRPSAVPVNHCSPSTRTWPARYR